MGLTVTLDLIVAALLAATIIYAVILSKRLGALRNDKAQLEALIRSLDESARRAESAIAMLKRTSDEAGRELQMRIDQGQGLRTDLSYMIDFGGGLADRLESGVRAQREERNSGAPRQPRPDETRQEARQEPRSQRRAAAPQNPEARPEARMDPAGENEDARVAGFPSRAERLLRRALDARR
jgi:hypothetical protein